MKRMMARTRLAVRSHGFNLPLVVLKRVLAPFLTTERILLYSRNLQILPAALESNLQNAAGRTSVGLHKLNSADSALFAELCRRYPDKNFAQRWREFGTQCFVAMDNDDIAGFAWVGRYRLRIAEINYQYPLASDELFIYDCFVEPVCRGRGIYTAMIEAIVEEGRVEGLKRALIAVSSINRPSIRGIVKAGFTQFNRIVYLNWSGREQWWGLDRPDSALRQDG